MSATHAESRYAFDNDAPEADAQLRTLESFLDPITAGRLADPILSPGMRCWEVGAGGGSVARLMARSVGPHGHVIATDIEPSHIVPRSNLAVLRHDVRGEPPIGGPFDVIHARLVLLHLPERKQILQTLIRSLAPGGWLVLEEFDCTVPLRVLTTPSDAAEKLFQQVIDAILGALQDRGADLAWAQNVHTQMALAGLTEVDTKTFSESWVGGSGGASLHAINSRQLEPHLIKAGLYAEELRAFRELAQDPRFAALSYQLVSTRGRRPVTPQTGDVVLPSQDRPEVVDEAVAADRLARIVATIAEIDADQVGLDTRFYDDLLIDSLQKLEIVVQIERTFGVKLTDHEAAGLQRVRDALTMLRGKGVLWGTGIAAQAPDA